MVIWRPYGRQIAGRSNRSSKSASQTAFSYSLKAGKVPAGRSLCGSRLPFAVGVRRASGDPPLVAEPATCVGPGGPLPDRPGPPLVLKRVAVRALIQQAEAERVLARQVSVHADLAGHPAGGDGVLVVAQDRLNRLHALGEAPGLLAEHRLHRLGRVPGALGRLPRLVQRDVARGARR